jgi:hypothetical protein
MDAIMSLKEKAKSKKKEKEKLLPEYDINGKRIYSRGRETERKEKFALEYHRTRNFRQAYCSAYTADKMDSTSIRVAANKVRHDPWVQERIAELDAELQEQTRLSLAQIINQLQEDRLLAHREGQAAAAVQADMHIAKILGFYWDRRQIVVSEDFDAMNVEELRAYVEAKTQSLGIAKQNGHLALDYAPGDYQIEVEAEVETDIE